MSTLHAKVFSVVVFAVISLSGAFTFGQTKLQPALRTWTDPTGKYKVEAEFVEFKDGMVHLRRANGRPIGVPIARLSKADQDYVRLPPSEPANTSRVSKTDPDPKGETTASAVPPTRTWTHRKGKSISAEFIAFVDGKVRIRRTSDGTIFDVSLSTLSDEDQEYVRRMEAKNLKPPPAVPTGEQDKHNPPVKSPAADDAPVQDPADFQQYFDKTVKWKGRVSDEGKIICPSRQKSGSFKSVLKLKSGRLPPPGTEVVFTGTLNRNVGVLRFFNHAANGTSTAETHLTFTLEDAIIVSEIAP